MIHRFPICLCVIVMLLFSLLLVGCFSSGRKITSWRDPNQASVVETEIAVPLREIPGQTGVPPFLGVEATGLQQPLLLIVDTGSTVTLLRKSLEPQLELKRLTEEPIETAQEHLPSQDVFITSDLKLGNLPLKSERVVFLPDSEIQKYGGGQLDGILGASLLNRGEIEINTRDRLLMIRPFSQAQVEQFPQVQLLHIADTGLYAIPLQSEDGKRWRFLLDTGCNMELVLSEEGQLGKEASQGKLVDEFECRMVGKTIRVKRYPLPRNLRIPGRFFERGTPVHVYPLNDDRFEGVIGIGLVWAFDRVLFNQQKERAAFVGSHKLGRETARSN